MKTRRTLVLCLLMGFLNVSRAFFVASLRTRSSCGGYTQVKTNNNDDMDWEDVSDAEALLACQGYLVRKKRFEWKAAAERRRLQESGRESGFFWEDPNQLVYLKTIPKLRHENNDDWVEQAEDDLTEDDDDEEEEEDDEQVDEEGIWETVVHSSDTARPITFLPVDDEEHDEEEDLLNNADEYSAIDGTPSPSHLRRSQAVSRRWADPAWKAYWYQQRWGNHHKTKRYNKKLKERLIQLDPDRFLASPEMAALTPDEITQAIRTHVISKQKRAASRQRSKQAYRQALAWDPSLLQQEEQQPAISRNDLLQVDSAAQEEAQRQRSERAKRAYQKRLERQHHDTQKSKPTIQPDPTKPVKTPLQALAQIQDSLATNTLPSIQHVELMLQPSKLAGRKDVLRQILSQFFDLRGKCIPQYYVDGQSKRLLFVTHCSIDVIGAFVLDQLRQANNDSKSGPQR